MPAHRPYFAKQTRRNHDITWDDAEYRRAYRNSRYNSMTTGFSSNQDMSSGSSNQPPNSAQSSISSISEESWWPTSDDLDIAYKKLKARQRPQYDPEQVAEEVEQVSEIVENDFIESESTHTFQEPKVSDSNITVANIGNMTMRELRSEEFTQLVDNAFNIGRREIADAAKVVSSLGEVSFINDTENVAFKAMQELRGVFEKLDPAEFQSGRKIFGLIPLPIKRGIVSYLQKFKSSTEMIDNLVSQLDGAQNQLVSDTAALGDVHRQLVDSYNKLEDIEIQLMGMEKHIEEQIKDLDEDRRKYVEAELLFYLRRNIQAVQAQKATSTQGILNIESQRKAARSLINGCDEMKTMGAATLSLAVDLARTQGFQITVMGALMDGRAAINSLITAVSVMNADHAGKIIEFESKPVQDIDTLGKAIQLTVETIKKTEAARITNGQQTKQNTERLRALMNNSAIAQRLELEAGIQPRTAQLTNEAAEQVRMQIGQKEGVAARPVPPKSQNRFG